MTILKAKNNYIGQGGCKRMNCSQSVADAFKEKFNLQDDFIDSLKSFGGGNAPLGVCGAFYAVKRILEEYDKEKTTEFEQYFLEHARALKCTEIKGLKKISCVGCVEKSSEFLENID